MAIGRFARALRRDERGKGALKFALGTCVIAFAVAAASPGFDANPMFNGMIHKLRQQLPDTLDQARRAMGG